MNSEKLRVNREEVLQMKPEIKERIEKIKRGEVPEGYFKINEKIMPNGWEFQKISKLLKVKHGKSQKEVECANGKYPILATGGEIGRTNSYLYDKPSVLIGRKGTIDKPKYMETPFWTVDTLFYTEIKKDVIPKWLYYKFWTIPWRIYNEASGVPSLSASTIESIKLEVPPKPEQQKIAEILSTWDKAIELKEKLIEEKKKQKKGLMQLLLTGKKRLPGFKGEWKEVKLGSVIREIKEKTTKNNQFPVLTSSRKGIFLQKEYFNKSVASSDNTGYKIIRKGQFTYRSMSDDGNFKFNQLTDYDIGIVSPAYVVFEATKINDVFLRNLMNDYSFNRHIQKVIQGGTRLSLKYNVLKEIIINIPDIEEQKAIANVLSTIDKEIELLEQELEALKLQKKGLMQLLLTGIVRVTDN